MSRQRWLLLLGLAVALAACKAKRAPVEDNELELERRTVGDALAELQGIVTEARTRASRGDLGEDALRDREPFYHQWYGRCAAIAAMTERLRASGEAMLVDRADAMCLVELPTADMQEIVAILRAEKPEDRAATGCASLAKSFADDLARVTSAHRLAGQARASDELFKQYCR